MSQGFWKNKSVFLTGHTGFKGGWLASWLVQKGARVHGYALPPPTEINFYSESNLQQKLTSSVIGDIRDLSHLTSAAMQAKPDIIFHLAAQPLVRQSYKMPVETYGVNIMGTVNILEAARFCQNVKAIVIITTDKCYENKEWVWSYRETDGLGGHDPYSSSKACAELITATYRTSFLSNLNIHVASARAGNVIGGGDWADDRLLPDFMRALNSGKILKIRSPNAIRPWQHVLDPLSGYLNLAEKLYTNGESFASAWNFGSSDNDAKTVASLMDHLCSIFPKAKWESISKDKPYEAGLLKLDSSKAKALLGWRPQWDIESALSETIKWYEAWFNGNNMQEFTSSQIISYETNMLDQGSQ